MDILGLKKGNQTVCTFLSNCCKDPSDFGHPQKISEFCQSKNISSIEKVNYVSCDNYVYDDSIYKSTIITEFNLYCDKQYLVDLSSSAYQAGFVVGYFFAGPLASAFGRKTTTVFGFISISAFCFYAAFAPDITNYIIARFLIAFSAAIYYNGSMNGMLELTGSKKRTLVNFIYSAGFSLGCLLLSYPFALFFNEWRDLQLAIGIFCLPFVVILYFGVEESWKWKMEKNQVDEAKRVAQKIYKKQHKGKNQEDLDKISDNIDSLIILANKDEEDHVSSTLLHKYKNLVKYKKINLISLIIIIIQFTACAVYWGINLSAGSLPGSDLFNNAALGLIELPGNLGMLFLAEKPKIGRKYFMMISLWGSGICYLTSVILLNTGSQDCDGNNLQDTVGRILAFAGKMCIAGSTQTINQYMSEFYSTDIRTEAFGVALTIGKIGSVIAPFIIGYFSDLLPFLPGIVFGGLCGLSGFLCIFLPETLGKPMVLKIHELNRSI